MRKLAPKLDLRGDTRKAKAWIPWAQRQLDRLKLLLVGQPINRVLRPISGVAVYVRSVHDIDFIRIAVALKKEEEACQADFTFNISGNDVDFTSELSGLADKTFWEFGDGEFEISSLNPSHTYPAPGSYTARLMGYNLDTTAPVSDKTITFTSETRGDGASAVSHADSYSLWSALPWSSGGNRSRFLASYTASIWRTFGGIITATIPLQDIASAPAVLSGKAIIYVTGNWLTYIVIGASVLPIVKKVSGSDLGLSTRSDFAAPNDSVADLISVGVPMVESSVKIIDASDIEPWTIIPDDPAVWGSNTGWSGLSSSMSGLLKVIPYTCVSIKEKIITIV